MSGLSKREAVDALLDALHAAYGVPGSGCDFAAEGRDLELVVTRPEGREYVEGAIWDVTDDEPVDVCHVRLAVWVTT